MKACFAQEVIHVNNVRLTDEVVLHGCQAEGQAKGLCLQLLLLPFPGLKTSFRLAMDKNSIFPRLIILTNIFNMTKK